MPENGLISAHLDHRRSWEKFYYVYPVISRRSQGVSIGINLNPDKICNFDCIYCEVDRITPPRIRQVNLSILAEELKAMLEIVQSGELFQKEPFASAPLHWRRLNDIAFSGDGEPTTCPVFFEAVQIASQLRQTHAQPDTKLVLITDSACLDRPQVKEGLKLMSQVPHDVWAKLDAGTEEYYKLVNRTAISYERILRNITQTALWFPLTIQSLFLSVHGQAPSTEEIDAYCQRLNTMLQQGAQLLKLQLYTVARPTPESWARPLTKLQLDTLAQQVAQKVPLPQELAYGPENN
jgi:wyosine [tRNA(Phe)-imidazoG37] synthetase (radical SAM superfamily)